MTQITISTKAYTDGRTTARLVLPFELRQRSRLLATLDSGEEVGLLLPRGTVLRGGDRLQVSDGRLVESWPRPSRSRWCAALIRAPWRALPTTSAIATSPCRITQRLTALPQRPRARRHAARARPEGGKPRCCLSNPRPVRIRNPTRTTAATTMTTADMDITTATADPLPLLRLLQLASPALPVGAFNFSQGLEYAVEQGWVRDGSSAAAWILGIAQHSVATLDLPLLLRMHAAAEAGDAARLRQLSHELIASRETQELRAEERHMGQALAKLLCGIRHRRGARVAARGRSELCGAVRTGGPGRTSQRPRYRRGLPVGMGREPGDRCREADPARADRWPARAGIDPAAHSGVRRHRHCYRRTKRSAAPRRWH